jgi:signal transduction histidine kinase
MVLELLPIGVVIADSTGRFIGKNEIADNIWGGCIPTPNNISEYQNLKAWWADNGMMVRPNEWPIAKALELGETSIGAVIDISRFDGTMSTILNSAAPIRDGEGKIIGGVSTLQDITWHRELEYLAVKAYEQAEEYIELLSHDISNMNAAVSSYLQAAVDNINTDQKNTQLFTKSQEILSNSNELIETVRKLRRVEGQDSRYGLVDLGWLLEDVRAEYEQYPGREVNIRYKTSIKQYVLGDDLLRDVFTNLLSNSIKHSSGPVSIFITLTKTIWNGKIHYEVIIEDDGPGIPDEIKSKLFQRNKRGRAKATGNGLGLYLVKRLVDRYDGQIKVEDRVPGDPSRGARFVVLLPAARDYNF